MSKNKLTGPIIDNPKLGKCLGVYHIKFSPGCLIPVILLIVPTIGLLMFFGADTIFEKIASLIFLIIFTPPIVFVIWKILPKVRDELKIYEKGFTYKSPKGLQSCLWTEIKDGTFSVGIDGREFVNAFIKKNGEKISFVYNMQGLVKLNSLYDEEIFREVSAEEEKDPAQFAANRPAENHPLELGELQNIYHVKYGFGEIFVHGLVLLPWAFFTVGMIATRGFILLIFVIPLSIFFFGMLWSTFQDRNDELRIFQNGFTYQSRKKGLQTCLWSEITDSRGSRWSKTISDIKTQKGEWINFANAMTGLENLTARRNKQLE